MLAISLSYMTFIMLKNAPSIPTLLSVFIINGCSTLSYAFSHLLICSCDFYLCFCLCDVLYVLVCEHCTIFASLGWISLDHGMIFLIYCWMWFANILLRILASVLIGDIGLKFSLFVVALSGFGIRTMLFHKQSLGIFHLLGFFGIVCEGWVLAPP